MDRGVPDYFMDAESLPYGGLDFHVYRRLSPLDANGDVLCIRAAVDQGSMGSARHERRCPAALDSAGKSAMGNLHVSRDGSFIPADPLHYSAGKE